MPIGTTISDLPLADLPLDGTERVPLVQGESDGETKHATIDDIADYIGGSVTVSAANVSYVPSSDTEWEPNGDPGDVNDALDQLADRLSAIEYAGKLVPIAFACGDLVTALTTGTTKGYAINPFHVPFIVVAVVASLVTAQSSGSIFTVDINEGSGVGTSFLSTKLTIDNGETVGGSNAAAGSATPAVISEGSIAAYGRITADIDQVGDGTAKGLIVYVLGYPLL